MPAGGLSAAGRAGSAARHARRVLREEGPRSLAVRVLARTVYRRLALYVSELDPATRAASPPPGVRCERLDAGSLDDYLALRADRSREEIVARLAAGHQCLITRARGRVINGLWLARERPWVAYLGCHLDLADGEAYIYDSFTAPEVRGQGTARQASAVLRHGLAADGCHRVVILVLPENRPGIRHAEKTGYRRVGTLRVVSLGPWRWVSGAGGYPVKRGAAACRRAAGSTRTSAAPER